jgi:hypothetical protein
MFSGMIVILVFIFSGMSTSAERTAVLQSWAAFSAEIATNNYSAAYDLLSDQFRASLSYEQFTNSILCTSYRDIVTAPVRRVRVSCFGKSANLIVTPAQLSLPLCLEDGFIALEVELKRLEGQWVVSGFPALYAK